VTWDVLRGPRYRRLFPDTYVKAAAGEPGLRLRSHAAYRYVEGRGIVAGYSAAELLGASCGRHDSDAEVIVWKGRQRDHPGLFVHRDQVDPDEIVDIAGIQMTSPVRTAYDLARRGDLIQRVVAVDALANAHGFEPDLLLLNAARHQGSRGNQDIAAVLTHADRRAGSPMETRLRLILVCAGLPRPHVQWPVQNPAARTAAWLDLAYPEHMIGIEYDGSGHTEPATVLRDIDRHTALLDQGWQVYRYTKHDVLRQPDRIVAQIRRALARSRCT
jgi:very-short-patch-repair endonuclease